MSRADQVNAIGGTTVIHDHIETTLARRQTGNLDNRADRVCSRRKDTARWSGVSDRRRVGRVARVGSGHAKRNMRPIDALAWDENFRGTLNAVTIGLGCQWELHAEQEQNCE